MIVQNKTVDNDHTHKINSCDKIWKL